jgi:SAM-dependent methyltransferase
VVGDGQGLGDIVDPPAAPSPTCSPRLKETTVPTATTTTRRGSWHGAYEVLTAVSMTVGRGPAARAVAEAAQISPQDRVVDVGCGPGTATRLAARGGAAATGIDPSPAMLRLARWISTARRVHGIDWHEGRAEALPVPDATATLGWALSTVHHWDNPAAGLSELYRILAPGGRVLLAERLVRPGARGHAAHGLTCSQADALASLLAAAGFIDLHTDTRQAGRRTLIILRARRPG